MLYNQEQPKNINEDANSNDAYEYKFSRIKQLQKSRDEIKDNLTKIKEKDNLTKTISDIVSKEIEKIKKEDERPQSSYRVGTNQSYYSQYIQKNEESKVLNFELEHLRQENIVLKNDNIIIREEVNRLNEIGSSLEAELDFSRRKK